MIDEGQLQNLARSAVLKLLDASNDLAHPIAPSIIAYDQQLRPQNPYVFQDTEHFMLTREQYCQSLLSQFAVVMTVFECWSSVVEDAYRDHHGKILSPALQPNRKEALMAILYQKTIPPMSLCVILGGECGQRRVLHTQWQVLDTRPKDASLEEVQTTLQ